LPSVAWEGGEGKREREKREREKREEGGAEEREGICDCGW